MPKTRGRVTKKAKNLLTRNRKLPKSDVDEGSTNSEQPTSPESKYTETSSPSLSPSLVSPKIIVTDTSKQSQNEDKEPEPWENLPDLVSEIRSGGTFTYITNDFSHREFELNARKELSQLYDELDLLKQTCASSMRVTNSICPESNFSNISEAIKALGVPTTFKELVLKLISLSSAGKPQVTPKPPHSDSELVLEDDNYSTIYSGKNVKFPSPSKMTSSKFITPTHHGNIFRFGTAGRSAASSANKPPRLAKPGEIIYSEGGSPILQRRIQEDSTDTSRPHERFEVIEPDGSKIEVDLVYRGTQDVDKIRAFKEFSKDVRGVAASRSTTAKQNRIQPARINVNKTPMPMPLSASKKKPDWR